MAISITNTSRKLTNINTGNDYGDYGYVNPISDSVNIIGEKKRIEFVYETDYANPIDGLNFYINLGLFMPVGAINPIVGKGTVFFECAMPSSAVPGIYPCNLNSTSTLFNLEVFRNFYVEIHVFDSNTFSIVAEFYQTYDLLGYMTSSMVLENRTRFLKDKYNSSDENIVSGPSIYNDGSVPYDGRLYIYVENQSDNSINGKTETSFGGYVAKFYNQASSTVSIESIKYYTIGSIPQEIPQPNLNVNTKVEIKLSTSALAFTPKIYVNVFKTNNSNNVLNFIDNYESETSLIDPAAPDQDLVSSPFVAPFDPDGFGINFTASFALQATALDAGDQLAFLFMIYDPTGVDVAGGGIVERAGPAQADIPYNGNGFTPTGTILDYDTEFTGNDVECVVEERMASKLVLDFPSDQWRNDLINRLGIDIGSNNIIEFLDRIKFTIYEETTAIIRWQPLATVENYFIERTMLKSNNNINPYTGTTDDFTIDFDTPDQLTLEAFWRNGFEFDDCIRSIINGVDYGTKLSNQDWAGKTLKVEWELTFYYDTIPVPFIDIIIFGQQIRVNDYSSHIEIHTRSPSNEGDTTFCDNANIHFIAQLDVVDADDYKLINNFDVDPGSRVTMEERENWVGRKLPQLFSTKLANQEVDYTGQTIDGVTYGKAAQFDVVPIALPAGLYKVSALAKKYNP